MNHIFITKLGVKQPIDPQHVTHQISIGSKHPIHIRTQRIFTYCFDCLIEQFGYSNVFLSVWMFVSKLWIGQKIYYPRFNHLYV